MPQHKRIGAAMLLVGACLAMAITLHPQALKAPAWVAYLAAGLFAGAGATALARAFQLPRVADGLVCFLLAGMLLTAAWIAFGPGPRLCAGGSSTGRRVVSESPAGPLSAQARCSWARCSRSRSAAGGAGRRRADG